MKIEVGLKSGKILRFTEEDIQTLLMFQSADKGQDWVGRAFDSADARKYFLENKPFWIEGIIATSKFTNTLGQKFDGLILSHYCIKSDSIEYITFITEENAKGE